MKPARHWWATEVIQTSAMDCGPATLKCLLQGYGVEVSYERLREACQTDVDGTTIDTLEEIAITLGLDAQQILLPADHLFLSGANALPCIAVVRLPSGVTHFVVVWRQYGPIVEVMDPAMGRRWMTRDALLNELYEHQMAVPAVAWRDWAASGDFLRPLDQRLARLGLARASRSKWVTAALHDPGWRSLARLDAVVRLADSLRQAKALRTGRAAERLIDLLLAANQNGAADALLAPHYRVRPAPAASESDNANHEEGDQVLIRGAVLVRCVGVRSDPVDRTALPPELALALSQSTTHPLRELWCLLRGDGWVIPGAAVLASMAAATAVVLEALLFRSFLDVGDRLVLTEQRVGASVALLALLAAALVLDTSLGKLLWRSGRQLELRMRSAFLEKIPRLSDRHFHSRLMSDMAERAHLTYLLRTLPDLGGQALRIALELLFTAAAIVWLDRDAAVAACAAVVLALVIPLAVQPMLQGRDLKLRTHSGALTRFHLDALLGMIPIRSHGAQGSFRRAHESLLVEWARAGFALQRLSTRLDAVQWSLGLALGGWIVFAHRGAHDFSAALMLLYWALKLPVLGQELALLTRQYPSLHNLTLRLLEPLSAVVAEPSIAASSANALTTPAAADAAGKSRDAGVSLELDNVDVRIAGHAVLHGINLRVAAGEHVAIVGHSGAGKSALLGLLLGWHRPAGGSIRVDGTMLDDARLDALRSETAWADPAVQLWNRSLYENLRYGVEADAPSASTELTAAGLQDLLQRLPEGLQTSLGEGGTLLSGGEGQRVRIGRALARENTRLILLDEPFRGLARDERSRLLAHARARWPGATLLLVTHDIADTQGFDRVLVMHDGRLVEEGAPRTLADCPGSRYATLVSLDAQARESLWNHADWRRLWLEDGAIRERTKTA